MNTSAIDDSFSSCPGERRRGGESLHPGLQSHEIQALSARYGEKVFESYLENKTPAAGAHAPPVTDSARVGPIVNVAT